MITRDRMLDVSLVGNGERTRVDSTQWSDRDLTTVLQFTTGAAGTWVAGVSTRARSIELDAASFNDYLEHDGVLDMLDRREANGTLDQDAIERYSKHVKTIFQVGDTYTDDWQTELGYSIEFIPLQNPYTLHVGATLGVRLLRDGQPLANQLVYAGSEGTGHDHDHDHDHNHDHDDGEDHSHGGSVALRTNDQGEVSVPLNAPGSWYVRTIQLVDVDEPGLTHESNWATLTFGVAPNSASVAASDHDHAHDHDHDHHHGPRGHTHGFNWYWLIGLVLTVVLGGWLWQRRG